MEHEKTEPSQKDRECKIVKDYIPHFRAYSNPQLPGEVSGDPAVQLRKVILAGRSNASAHRRHCRRWVKGAEDSLGRAETS